MALLGSQLGFDPRYLTQPQQPASSGGGSFGHGGGGIGSAGQAAWLERYIASRKPGVLSTRTIAGSPAPKPAPSPIPAAGYPAGYPRPSSGTGGTAGWISTGGLSGNLGIGQSGGNGLVWGTQPNYGGTPAGGTGGGSFNHGGNYPGGYGQNQGGTGTGTGSGGTGGVGGTNGGNLSNTQAADRLKALEDAANKANEDRYRQLLQGADASKADLLTALSTQGQRLLGLPGQTSDAKYQREQRLTNAQLGQVQQSATTRGIGNTTVVDSLRRGVLDDSQLRKHEIDDSRLGQQLGVGQWYTNQLMDTLGRANSQKLGIMENRTDQQPNLGMYYNLLTQPGAQQGTGTPTGGQQGTGQQGTDYNSLALALQMRKLQRGYNSGGTGGNRPTNSGGFGGLTGSNGLNQARQGFESQAPRYPSSASNSLGNILGGYSGAQPYSGSGYGNTLQASQTWQPAGETVSYGLQQSNEWQPAGRDAAWDYDPITGLWYDSTGTGYDDQGNIAG